MSPYQLNAYTYSPGPDSTTGALSDGGSCFRLPAVGNGVALTIKQPWAWAIIDETDAGLSDDLRQEWALEGAVLLRKGSAPENARLAMQ